MSRALEEYMRHSLEEHTNKFEQQISKLNKRQHSLLLYVLEFHEIRHSDIEDFIKFKMGLIDKRTINKYFQFLLENKIIKTKKALYGRDVIYIVDQNRILSILEEYLDNDQLKAARARIENNRSEELKKQDIEEYAYERYEAGDSLKEIREKLEDFGEFNEKQVKGLLRNAIRRMRQ
ncbi:hypothetical protein DRP05_12805 [Archaeoglobales archaeon]|nr:MAG: hypothetical protein DRP05_12805 [Archaeoglobales archaeon]